ncbi:MAG: undecaprenyl-diphosphate phosphatase [Succinivibrio sp.]|nr:undecaprenyl-diphosphate phosphatase [Succinivibrio sp.]
MGMLQITVLAIIQGLTEFLPVSSSAHLIFPSKLFGWPDQGLAFDVAVHVGTLLAVIFYYMADLVKIATYTIEAVFKGRVGPVARVGFCLILASIPAGICGLLFEDKISTEARAIDVIAYTTIGFGLLLGLASYVNRHLVWRTVLSVEGERADTLRHLTYNQAIIIGCAQALAIVPGTSRSGVTLTAGMFLGMRPEAAARFSFLLSIPVIFCSGLLEGYKLYTVPDLGGADVVSMLIGGFISFLVALVVIHMFLRYISRSGMAVFVIYRLLLGALLLWMF